MSEWMKIRSRIGSLQWVNDWKSSEGRMSEKMSWGWATGMNEWVKVRVRVAPPEWMNEWKYVLELSHSTEWMTENMC